MATQVRRAFKYRFCPSDAQAAELSRTFGCVQKVYNLALAARTEAWTAHQEQVDYHATSAMPTAWKKTEELAFLTMSTGEKIADPRHESKDRARLAKAQRNLVKKAKGSANRAEARLEVAKIHARIADRRRDHLHKVTTRLVRENQTIVIEDLTVGNTVKNHRPARAVSDAAWREFRSLLEYKARWYGRDLVVVDRWFPSSELCSVCGTLQGKMPLSVRTWTCGCGAVHDRDVNAAKNLLAAGWAVTACGAGATPQRSSPGGQSATKQETSQREP